MNAPFEPCPAVAGKEHHAPHLIPRPQAPPHRFQPILLPEEIHRGEEPRIQ